MLLGIACGYRHEKYGYDQKPNWRIVFYMTQAKKSAITSIFLILCLSGCSGSLIRRENGVRQPIKQEYVLNQAARSFIELDSLDKTAVRALKTLRRLEREELSRRLFEKFIPTARKVRSDKKEDGTARQDILAPKEKDFDLTIAHARQLYTQAENQLDKRFEEVFLLFRHHGKVLDYDRTPVLRASLFRWVTLVRKGIGRQFPTEVPGLKDQSDCSGDIIGDRLLWNYIAKTIPDPSSETYPAESPIALAQLSRQLSCLSGRQAAVLDYQLVNAFNQLKGELIRQGYPDLVPFVARSLANVFILSWDQVKFHGKEVPTYTWLKEHRKDLEKADNEDGSPIKELGFWLYDRTQARLRGFSASCSELRDPICVDWDTLLASIVDPKKLGFGDCSLSEMILNGKDQQGYSCMDSVCITEQEAEVAAKGVGINHKDFDRPTRQIKQQEQTPFGVSVSELSTACPNRDRSSSGREGLCGGGVEALMGRDRLCLSEILVSEGPSNARRCFANALGACDGPIKRLETKVQSYPGERGSANKSCTRSQGLSDKEKKQKEEELVDKFRKTREKAEAAARRVVAAEILLETLKEQNKQAGQKWSEAHDLPPEEQEKAINAAGEEWDRIKKLLEQAKKALAEAEEKAQEAAEAARKAQEALEEARRKQAEEMEKEQERQEQQKEIKFCSPEDETCTSNCTAMSEEFETMKECFTPDQFFPDTGFRESVDPGVVDPSPLDDPVAAGWARCFAEGLGINPISKNCAATMCPENQEPVYDPYTGLCKCGGRQGGGGAGRPSCATQLDCGPDAQIVIKGGRCYCEALGGENRDSSAGAPGRPWVGPGVGPR